MARNFKYVLNYTHYDIILVMVNPKKNEENTQELMVNTKTVIGSVYAQIVGVTVTDIDVTLEFVYKHPREEVKEAQVVARVTLPKQSGESLARSIIDTVKLHEAKKKGEKNG